MPNQFPPLIYVDLICDEFPTYDQWIDTYPGSSVKEYQTFKDRHQPWRVLVKSGDNHEPLFRSTEAYLNKADAIHAAHLAFGTGSNVYLRQAEQGGQLLRRALEA